MRERLKRIAELGLTGSGATGLLRRLAPDNVAIVAYHNVVRTEDVGLGDASLHIGLELFIAHIERLRRTHEIIPLDEIDAHPRSGRPHAVVTFDDAYQGAITLALPELAKRAIPATMFVAPDLLGSSATWWDEGAARGLLTDAWRERALTSLQGRSVRVRADFPSAGSPALPASYRIASNQELERARYPGLALGSHTWAHEFLPALDAADLRATLERSLAWLEQRSEAVTRWLALPYGGWSAAVEATALEVGYRGVLLVEGGPARRGSAGKRLPRINVPAGLSVAGFELRTSALR